MTRIVEGRNLFKILTVKFTGKIPVRKSRNRWKENVRMNLKSINVSVRS